MKAATRKRRRKIAKRLGHARKHRRLSNTQIRLGIEQLEDRLLLAGDVGGYWGEDYGSFSFDVSETAEVGTVVGTVEMTNSPSDPVSYGIASAYSDAPFTLDPETGVVTVAGPLDVEAVGAYYIDLYATDAQGNPLSSAYMAISVLDREDDPAAGGADSSGTNGEDGSGYENSGYWDGGYGSFSFNVAEDVAVGTVAGTVQASNPPADPVTYSIASGYADEPFAVDANTGVITVAAPLDYEFTSSHNFDVHAADTFGNEYLANVSIDVQDVEEAPLFDTQNDDSFGSYAFFVLNEANPEDEVGTASATDPQGDTVTYRFGSDNVERFHIDSSTGQITVASQPISDPMLSAMPLWPDAVQTFYYDVIASDSQGNESFASVEVFIGEMDVYHVSHDTLLVSNESDGPAFVTDNDGAWGNADPVQVVNSTQHGQISMQGYGAFTYLPNPHYVGEDFFTYIRSDENVVHGALREPREMAVKIVVTNDPPTTQSDEYSTTFGQPLLITAKKGLLENDSDEDSADELRIRVAENYTQPEHGAVTVHRSGAFIYTPNVPADGSSLFSPGSYSFTDTFTYEATDSFDNSDPATVTITVNNTVPYVQADSYSVAHDGPTLFVLHEQGVLVNDEDADGHLLGAGVVSGASNGTLDLKESGAFSYKPNANFAGQDSFTYRAFDGAQYSEAATVTIDVLAVDVQSENDYYTVTHDQKLVVKPGEDILANDAYEAGYYTLEVESEPGQGDLELNEGGSFTYTPEENQVGEVSFTYKLTSTLSNHDAAIGTVFIDVQNSPPGVLDDQYTVPMDRVLSVSRWDGPLANDDDADGDLLIASSHTNGAYGTVSMNPDGSFRYEPIAGFLGTDTFSYEADDGISKVTGTVTIDVVSDSINSPPDTKHDGYSVLHDQQLVVLPFDGVLANDNDADGDKLTVTQITTSPTYGTVDMQANGSFVYTPIASFVGSDAFYYEVSDGQETTTAQVSIDTLNSAPISEHDSYDLLHDSVLTVTQYSGFLANDKDGDGDTLEIQLQMGPSNGTLDINPESGSFRYEPEAGFTGSDQLTYRLYDGAEYSEVATVTFNVTNATPEGKNDSYRVLHHDPARTWTGATLVADDGEAAVDGPLDVPFWNGVLANDADEDGDTLTAQLLSGPEHGEFQLIEATGSFRYVPEAGFEGTDSFTYLVHDGIAASVPVAVDIEVVNHAPNALEDSYLVAQNETLWTSVVSGVLGNDVDAEGDRLTAITFDSVANGTLRFDPSGSFSYTPNVGFVGTDSFTYSVTDGIAVIEPVLVTIEVREDTIEFSAQAPIAADDNLDVVHDRPLNVGPTVFGLLGNDSVRGYGLPKIAVVDDVSYGTLSITDDGAFTYRPVDGFVGSDSFTYQLIDQWLQQSNVATVTIDVTNETPKADADQYEVHAGETLDVSWVIGVLANDSDKDSGGLQAELLEDVSHGELTLNDDGSFIYTPELGFTGTDGFLYWATDGLADNPTAPYQDGLYDDLAWVSIDVTNSVPIATADEFSLEMNATLVIDKWHGVLPNDTDADGDELAVALLEDVQHGTLTFNDDGSLEYVAETGYYGSDSFVYWVTDGFTANPGEIYQDNELDDIAQVSLRVETPFEHPWVPESFFFSTTHDAPILESAETGLLSELTGGGSVTTAEVITDPVNGELVLHDNGSFRYTPSQGFVGEDSFVFQAVSGPLASEPSIVTIDVSNSVPYAEDRSVYVHHDSERLVDAEDYDALLYDIEDGEGDEIEIILVADVENGRLTLKENGAFRYVPTAAFVGTDSFSYKLSDGLAEGDPVTVTIEVFNETPSTADETYYLLPGQILVGVADQKRAEGLIDGAGFVFAEPLIDLEMQTNENESTYAGNALETLKVELAKQRDLDGNELLDANGDPVLVDDVESGTLNLYATGVWSYKPNDDFVGVDSFSYQISDGITLSEIATVTIQVDAGVYALDDVFQLSRESVLSIPFAQDGILKNDSADGFEGDTTPYLSVELLGPIDPSVEANGDLRLTEMGAVFYRPHDNFVGADVYAYQVTDTRTGRNDTAKITFNVVDIPPVTKEDTYWTVPDKLLKVEAPPEVDHAPLDGYTLFSPSGPPDQLYEALDTFSGAGDSTLDEADFNRFYLATNISDFVVYAPVTYNDEFPGERFLEDDGTATLPNVELVGAGTVVNDSTATAPTLELNADGTFEFSHTDPGIYKYTYQIENTASTGTITIHVLDVEADGESGEEYESEEISGAGTELDALWQNVEFETAARAALINRTSELIDLEIEMGKPDLGVAATDPNDPHSIDRGQSLLGFEHWTAFEVDARGYMTSNDTGFLARTATARDSLVATVVKADDAALQAMAERDLELHSDSVAADFAHWDSTTDGEVTHQKDSELVFQTFAVDTTAAEMSYLDAIAGADSTRDGMVAAAKQQFDLEVVAAEAAFMANESAALSVFKDSSDALEDSFESELQAALDTRDGALWNAKETYVLAIETADDDLQTAIDAASVSYESTVTASFLARDSAVAGAKSDYDVIVADAAAAYDAAGHDQEATTPLDLSSDPDYLAAVETAHQTYVGVVAAADALHATNVETARAELDARIQSANATAETAYLDAMQVYADAVDDVETNYDNEVQIARLGHDGAIKSANDLLKNSQQQARNVYNNAVRSAQDTYLTAVDNAELVFRDAGKNAQRTYDNGTADAQAAYDQSVSNAHADYQSSLQQAESTYIATLSSSTSTLDDEMVAAEAAYKTAMQSAYAAFDGSMSPAFHAAESTTSQARKTQHTAQSNAKLTLHSAIVTAHMAYQDSSMDARDDLNENMLDAQRERNVKYQAANAALLEALDDHGFLDTDASLNPAKKEHVVNRLEADHWFLSQRVKHRHEYEKALGLAKIPYARDVAKAQDEYVVSLAEASQAYVAATANAGKDYLNKQADAHATLSSAMYDAAAAKTKALAEDNKTWLDALADAGKTLADSHADAGHSFALAEADAAENHSLAQTNASIQFRSDLQDAESEFMSALASAQHDLGQAQADATLQLTLTSSASMAGWRQNIATANAELTYALTAAQQDRRQETKTAGMQLETALSEAAEQWTDTLWATFTNPDDGQLSLYEFAGAIAATNHQRALDTAAAGQTALDSMAAARDQAITLWAADAATAWSGYRAAETSARRSLLEGVANTNHTLEGELADERQVFTLSQADAQQARELATADAELTLAQSVNAAQRSFLDTFTNLSTGLASEHAAASEQFALQMQIVETAFGTSLGGAEHRLAIALANAEALHRTPGHMAAAEARTNQLNAAELRLAQDLAPIEKALRQLLAGAERTLAKAMAESKQEHAKAANLADKNWTDATADAFAAYQKEMQQAESAYTKLFQGRMAQVQIAMAAVAVAAAHATRDREHHVNRDTYIAQLEARLRLVRSYSTVDPRVAEATSAITSATGKSPSLFAGVQPSSIPHESFDPLSVGAALFTPLGALFAHNSMNGRFSEDDISLQDLANVGAGILNSLSGGLTMKWFADSEYIDTNSTAFRIGSVIGVVGLIALSFIAPLACGWVGVVLMAASRALTVFGMAMSGANFIADLQDGTAGWHNALDLGLSFAPYAARGLGKLARARGLSFCFVGDTGVVMAQPEWMTPVEPAGYARTASGLLLPTAVAAGAFVAYSGLTRRKDKEEEQNIENPTRERGNKNRGVGRQPAENDDHHKPLAHVLRDFNAQDFDNEIMEPEAQDLAFSLSASDPDFSVARNATDWSSLQAPASSSPNTRHSKQNDAICSTTADASVAKSRQIIDPASESRRHSTFASHHSSSGSSRNLIAKIVLCVGLSISGLLFWKYFAGEPTLTVPAVTQVSAQVDRIKLIKDVQLGERTVGENPLEWQVERIPDPDPETWREVHFELTKPSGHRSWLKFLWPLEQIGEFGAKVGATVDFDMQEMGCVGPATCTFIGPCPPIQPGSGNVVTGRFKHEPDGPIVNVLVDRAADPIRCTDNHPFWSEDRQDFVKAGHLRVGENLWSDFHGSLRILSVTPAPDVNYVYNLQIHGQHVYEVAKVGALVHNTCNAPRGLGDATTSPWLSDPRIGVRTHIESFRGGGSYLVPKSAYERWIKGQARIGRADGQFVTTRSAMDRLLHEAGGSLGVVKKRLGIPEAYWNEPLYRVDIDNPLLHNARLPAGWESGANEMFRWGGYTSGGLPELIVDQIPAQRISGDTNGDWTMKEILRNSDRMYILYEGDDGGYVLSAMCGGVGMYEVKVQLTSEEATRFDAEGERYIDGLAFDISKETSKYQDRVVP